MNLLSSKVFLTIFVVVTALLSLTTTLVESRPASDDLSNMVEALRVLEQYDKMYSQLARPRFGRSLGMRASSEDEVRSLREDPVMQESHRQ